jgi:alpha,alpha-trehalase
MPAGEIVRAVDAIRRLREGRHLLLLLDFDGTLCEFNPDPEAVILSDVRRRLLLNIAEKQDASIAIVSGRRLADVRTRARLPGENYHAGLHGLEIEGHGDRFEHPHARKTIDVIRSLIDDLSRDFASLPGVFVEDKGLSAVAHFRSASPEHAEKVHAVVDHRARPFITSGELRVMNGACMIELLPNIDWNKGNAVAWIRERVESSAAKPVASVYIGDDVTDEDGFRAVRSAGVAIAASARASGGDYVIDGPREVEELLRLLAE